MAKTLEERRESGRLKYRKYYAANREKILARNRLNGARWRAKPENQEKLRAKRKRVDNHGVWKKRKERIAGRPRPDLCEVCGNPPQPGAVLMFDHCHQHGHFRGWICHGCNIAIGMAGDDPDRLRKLASYLEADRLKLLKAA